MSYFTNVIELLGRVLTPLLESPCFFFYVFEYYVIRWGYITLIWFYTQWYEDIIYVRYIRNQHRTAKVRPATKVRARRAAPLPDESIIRFIADRGTQVCTPPVLLRFVPTFAIKWLTSHWLFSFKIALMRMAIFV